MRKKQTTRRKSAPQGEHSRLPDELRREYESDVFRAAVPYGGDREDPTPKERFDALDPTLQAIHEDFASVSARRPNEEGRLLLAHLQRAAGLAAGANAPELARVLIALETALVYGDVGALTKRMYAAANGYLESKEPNEATGGKKSPLVRRLVDIFDESDVLFADEILFEPEIARVKAQEVILWLQGNRAETVLGPPQGKWWLEVIKEVGIVAADGRRKPEMFARAVLRGWGLTVQEARTTVDTAMKKA